MAENEIIVADNDRIKLALLQPESMEALLLEVQGKIKDFTGDVTTNAGRKEIASMAYKVARTKTTIDDFGKDLVGAAKKEIKKIDDARKLARETLDGWKTDVRKPLTDWEAEQARGEAEIERIVACAETRIDNPVYGEKLIADIESIDINIIPENLRESFVAARTDSVERLRMGVAEAIQREADAKDLERLRKEEVKRIVDEAKAKLQREAAEATETKVQQQAAAPVVEAPVLPATAPVAATPAPAPATKAHVVLMNEAYQDIVKIVRVREDAIALVKAIANNEIRNVQLVG